MKQREITGSLFERNGKYTAILNLYDENGKRKQKSIALGIPVKGNKRKAQARLEELKREYSTPAPQLARARVDSPLFADFLHDWLRITAPTIERTTYHSYESIINARLDPFFRERCLRLCDIEPQHIRELHESIFKDGCSANTRNICRVRRLNQYSRSKSGDAGSRMPSWMSWEAPPPMVKKDVPSISKTCPRIRWSTWGRI